MKIKSPQLAIIFTSILAAQLSYPFVFPEPNVVAHLIYVGIWAMPGALLAGITKND